MRPTIRLLYAEDNAQDADLTRSHFALHAPDFELQLVTTGAACLEQIQLSPPDVLLLDHQLPDARGVEILKALVQEAPDLPVVIVTGVGDEDVAVNALRLGARYVPKQGNYLGTLPGLLRDVLGERRRQRGGVLPSPRVPRQILYVEHLPMDIDLTLRHFSEAAPHLEVDVVRTSAEALVRLSEPHAYALALIDLRMPDQSGLDLVREARGRHLSLPPFITITGAGDEESAVAAFALGAADYCVKSAGYLEALTFRIDRAIDLDEINRGYATLRAEMSERAHAEQALAKSEHLYRMLSENADGAVLLVSPAGTFTWVSPSIERLLGYTPAEAIALDDAALVHPDDLDAARAAVQGDGPGAQVRFRRKDGQYRWMATTSRLLTAPDGVVTGRIYTLRDIHDEVLAVQSLAASEKLLRTVLDQSRDTAVRIGLDGRFEFVNQRVTEVSGIPFEQWIGSTFTEMGYPVELTQSWDAHRRRAFATGELVTFEFEIDNAEGHRWYETTVAPEVGADGTIAHVIETSRDITDRRDVEVALLTSQSRLEQAQHIASVGIWTLDLATGEVTRSDTLRLMQGTNPTDPELDYSESGRLFTPESWLRFTTATSHIQETGVPYDLELEMVRPDGSHGWMLVHGEAVRDAAGAIVGVTGVALDITDAKAASAALELLATRDPLTSLANRATLLDEITRALSAGARSGRSTAILMLDLDRFKDVNDTLGHAAGDELLVSAATRIEQVVRASDLVARLGGDEFVVVMRDLEDPTEAGQAALRLVEAFRAPFALAGAELFATASIGVAIATETSDASDLVREADTAMYAAKAAGRDRASVFNDDLRVAVTTRMAVEAALRHALERGQLAVWYQPEVDLTTGTVTAVEALLRWHHPDGTVWTADRFIDDAEHTGLILDIGDWVLHQACAQGAAWALARPDQPLKVRVNASALQLAETGLLVAIDDALAARGLNPGLLCIEMTETALLRETTIAAKNLDGIRERGIGIAIDDFGTGYAALTYLRKYPIDVIKIDRSFITHLTTDDRDRKITTGIISLATILDITVTAEGVEHPEQATILREIGCPSAQGWLYSKALPPEDVTRLLDHVYPHS